MSRNRDAHRRLGIELRHQRSVVHRISGEFLAHRQEAQPGQHRQQQRGAEQRKVDALIDAAAVEREVQAESAMEPPGHEQRELAPLAVGRPQRPYDARVLRRRVVELPRDARADHVADQQNGDAQSEQNAQELGRRHPQGPPAINGGESQHHVDARGAVQEQRARKAVPYREGDRKSALGGVTETRPRA